MKFESLHNHTVLSDGTQTPLELLRTAEQAGFGVMAITEHDVLPDVKTLRQLKTYPGPVKWLTGIEISSGWPSEVGGGPSAMFHILGLCVDPTNQPLQNYCRQALIGRNRRMELMVQNLQELGFEITAAECRQAAGGESVGRPHIATALLQHPQNLERLEKLRAEVELAAQTDPKWAAPYTEMMRRAQSQAGSAMAFGLLLGDDGFKSVYVESAYWVDLDECVRLIRDAGGIAILAHWPTAQDRIDADRLEKIIAAKRLDGLELITGFVGPNVRTDKQTLAGIGSRTSCATTIGIDCHRERDVLQFNAETGLGPETVGQTQKLIERFGPDLTWSNWA